MGQFDEFEKEKSTDNEPVWTDIVNRDGEPYMRKQDGKPMQFQVLGEYSERFEEISKRITNRTMKRLRQGDDLDADDTDDVTREKLSAAVSGWTLEVGGKDVPFNKPNFIEFLKAAPWNAVKLRQDVGKHHRFFKKASAA